MDPESQALLDLACSLLDDLATWFPPLLPSVLRDKKYLVRRVGNEGVSFLTKVLPQIGRAFDKWLKDEIGDPDLSVPYLAPAFLSGVKNLIGGEISPGDRAHLYRWLRQLSYLFYKLEVPYTADQLNTAFNKFAEVDHALEESDAKISWKAACVVGEVVGSALHGIDLAKAVPRHGPGAVATGEVGDAKWMFKRYYRSVHRVFPMYDWFVPSLSIWSRAPDQAIAWYKSLERLNTPTARVVAVPKDSRGPRLISEEPLELQYLQQGVFRVLVQHLEQNAPTKGFVNFTDQTINQRLALEGSLSGAWATIDLSDASDRVSDYLAYLVLPPSVYRVVSALRSRHTVLPDGRKVLLNKFAPMGSAICFPVEALLFWGIAVAALTAAESRNRSVYVYGDDIIVPNDMCGVVCQSLESFGLKVNDQKTYDRGLFRESCGVDAWNGYIVTPGRLRQLAPSHRGDSQKLSNWIAVSNHLRHWCFDHAASYMQKHVDSLGPFPWNCQGSGLSFIDDLAPHPFQDERNAPFKKRMSRHTHQPEMLVPVETTVTAPTSLVGWHRLHRNLVQPPLQPEVAVLRSRVRVRRRWTQVHR